MNQPVEQSDKTTGHRRLRFRFSLRMFCLFVFGTGIFVGVWVKTVQPVRVQWQAAEPLLKLGAEIETVPSGMPRWMTFFLGEGKTDYIVGVNFRRQQATEETVVALTQLPRLKRLYMERTGATDQHCEEIAKIKALERLSLWGTPVTDRGVQLLTKLPNLEIVDVTQTRVSWRSDLHFQDFPHIEFKGDFRGDISEVAPSALESTARLNQPVRSINLINPNDSDIQKAIDMLPALESITLRGNLTEVTPVGMAKLRDCKRLLSISIGQTKKSIRNLDSKLEIIGTVCQVWGPLATNVSFIEHELNYLEVSFDFAEGAQVRFTIDAERFLPIDFEAIEGLEQLEKLSLVGFNRNTIGVLKSIPNLKHLSISQVIVVPDQYRGEIANVEKLETFKISARLPWNEYSLPDNFFKDWKSRQTLRSVLILNSKVTGQQVRPILDFPNLGRIMIVSDSHLGDLRATNPPNLLSELREKFDIYPSDQK